MASLNDLLMIEGVAPENTTIFFHKPDPNWTSQDFVASAVKRALADDPHWRTFESAQWNNVAALAKDSAFAVRCVRNIKHYVFAGLLKIEAQWRETPDELERDPDMIALRLAFGDDIAASARALGKPEVTRFKFRRDPRLDWALGVCLLRPQGGQGTTRKAATLPSPVLIAP